MSNSFRKIEKYRGMSLVQLMIAIAIAGIIGVALFMGIFKWSRTQSIETAKIQLTEGHRLAMLRLQKDLSEAVRVNGALASIRPGIQRLPNIARATGEMTDPIQIRKPIYGEFSIMGETISTNSAYRISVVKDQNNAAAFELFKKALLGSIASRNIRVLSVSSGDRVNLVEFSSIENPVPDTLILVWDLPSNDIALADQLLNKDGLTLTLTNLVTYSVDVDKLLRREVTGTEVTSSEYLIEGVRKFWVNYIFTSRRGEQSVQGSETSRTMGVSVPEACVPSGGTVCQNYQDVVRMEMITEVRSSESFDQAAGAVLSIDHRISFDQGHVVLTEGSSLYPYSLAAQIDSQSGMDVGCAINNLQNHCKPECAHNAVVGAPPGDPAHPAYWDVNSPYCGCALRDRSNPSLGKDIPTTAQGQLAIRNDDTYGYGCDPQVDWCLGFDNWRNKWHDIRANPTRFNRLVSCAMAFNVCNSAASQGGSNVDGTIPFTSGYWLPIPGLIGACGQCTHQNPDPNAPDDEKAQYYYDSSAGHFKFRDGIFGDSSGRLRNDAGARWMAWVLDPANRWRIKCEDGWCPNDARAAAYRPGDPGDAVPTASYDHCRCNVRTQRPNWALGHPAVENLANVITGGNMDALAIDWERVCDLNSTGDARPVGDAPLCANTFAVDSGSKVARLSWDPTDPMNPATGNVQGLSRLQAQICQCLRTHDQPYPTSHRDRNEWDFRNTDVTPDGSGRPANGNLRSFIQPGQPYQAFASWSNGYFSYPANADRFGAVGSVPDIGDFQAINSTGLTNLPGGNCSNIGCDAGWVGKTCCVADSIREQILNQNPGIDAILNTNLGNQAQRAQYVGYCSDRCMHQYNLQRRAIRYIITNTQPAVPGVYTEAELPTQCGGSTVVPPGSPGRGGF